MAQRLLCDVCRQGREAKKYVIIIKEEGQDTAWSEKAIDRCPRCLERLYGKIVDGKV